MAYSGVDDRKRGCGLYSALPLRESGSSLRWEVTPGKRKKVRKGKGNRGKGHDFT